MKLSQITIGVATIALSWYAMMAVHEAGHCLGALLTGATIVAAEIPLTGFSRTDATGGRHPLTVIWAGPLFGAIAPLLLLPLLHIVRRPLSHSLQFFAGFCLLANGAYIGAGAFDRAGDCGRLLDHGSPLWLLVVFGIVSFTGGLYLWHRIGPMEGWFVRADGRMDTETDRDEASGGRA